MDSVEKYHYEVLLSYPNDDINKGQNKVEILNPVTGDAPKFSAEREPVEKNGKPDDEFPVAYHAYSPAKCVEGELIYANYATDDDFETLERNNIEVNGSIIIARNGKIFRGNKVLNAQREGAVGIILYTDPEEAEIYESEGVGRSVSWDISLPRDGLQRGTVYEKIGDPLTPGYPAVAEAPRIDFDEADLPDIPSQPIDANFAEFLIEHLGGRVMGGDWRGGFEVPNYRLGPGFEGTYENYTVRMDIKNELELEKIVNVIAKIDGRVEPDRYVIVGNSFDAWGYGAINPSSSTAQLLEISRAFNELLKKKWRPRRTIIFAAWDAGKFGQIGSTEWVEEHLDLLMSRTVVYINSESCIETDDIEVSCSPVLEEAVLETARVIEDEDSKFNSLHEDWKNKFGHTDFVTSLGAESDHAAFAFYAGIPSVDIHSQQERGDAQFYPRQNSRYDNLELVKNIDGDYKRMRNCAQYTAALVYFLADSVILPYNVKTMSDLLVESYKTYNSSKIQSIFEKRGIKTFDDLGQAILEFDVAAEKFHEIIDDVDTDNPIDVRMVNDQLMLLERAFIKPTGDDDDWFHRHLLFGPTDLNKNADSIFYVFEELMELIDDVESEEEEESREEKQGFEEPDPEDDINVEDFWEENERYIIEVILALKEGVKILKPLLGAYDYDDDDD